MNIFLITVVSIISLTVGYFCRMFTEGDDGLVVLEDKHVEVIFRDPYEKLVKKRSVHLRMKS